MVRGGCCTPSLVHVRSSLPDPAARDTRERANPMGRRPLVVAHLRGPPEPSREAIRDPDRLWYAGVEE